MTLLRSDADPGTTVTVVNKRTGETQEARVDEHGTVREGGPPNGAAYSAGQYAIAGDEGDGSGRGQTVVAYEYEVKGPASREWTKHLEHAADCPENPKDAWRDDHRVRNVRPLIYGNEDDE